MRQSNRTFTHAVLRDGPEAAPDEVAEGIDESLGIARTR